MCLFFSLIPDFCLSYCFVSIPGAANTSATRPHPAQQAAYIVGMTIAYVVVFLIGFFGNALVIYIVASRKRMKSTFNFLIVNMAIGDFLVCLFIMPAEVGEPGLFEFTLDALVT